MKKITTQQILKANPDDVMTQRQFRKDNHNYEYELNIKYTTLGDKPLARFYFDDDTTVSLYDENGKLEWSDWYSKYKAWEKNGEFIEVQPPMPPNKRERKIKKILTIETMNRRVSDALKEKVHKCGKCGKKVRHKEQCGYSAILGKCNDCIILKPNEN